MLTFQLPCCQFQSTPSLSANITYKKQAKSAKAIAKLQFFCIALQFILNGSKESEWISLSNYLNSDFSCSIQASILGLISFGWVSKSSGRPINSLPLKAFECSNL